MACMTVGAVNADAILVTAILGVGRERYAIVLWLGEVLCENDCHFLAISEARHLLWIG
jgi:hypothetical protein